MKTRMLAAWTAVILFGLGHAQYVGYPLPPSPGSQLSGAFAAYGGEQYGFFMSNGSSPAYPAEWHRSIMQLAFPQGATGGEFQCATRTHAFAGVSWLGLGHAFAMERNTGNWIDLHPANLPLIANSFPQGAYDATLAGYGDEGYPHRPIHALYWPSVAAYAIDLSPAGYSYSWCNAMSGNQQVGAASISSPSDHFHAAIWHGTADSFVDLNPSFALQSQATATDGRHQFGWYATPQIQAAAMWSATAESVVSLAPPGWVVSWIQAAGHGMEVGAGSPDGNADLHALAWLGTSGTYVDLHQFLPQSYGFTSSQALGVDPLTGDIVGYAGSQGFGTTYAVIWRRLPSSISPTPLG